MQPDYPAAHSMDVEWFAVDRCGHVALFDGGEDGPVPWAADRVEDVLEASRPFVGELDRCLRERLIVPGVHRSREEPMSDVQRVLERADGFYLLGPGLKMNSDRIRTPALSNARTGRPEPLTFGTADGRDWVEGRLSPESWAWLHEVPHRCLGCVPRLALYKKARLQTFRFSRYENDRYGNKPYEKCEEDPSQPTTLEDLRRVITWPISPPLVFSAFCFLERKFIQPLQWFPSQTWSDAALWMDEEGNEREGGALTEP
jgi:hypothetical protein